MNQMQKLLLYASLLVVAITVLLGYTLVDNPDAGFHIRMGFMVFAEIVFCVETILFTRSNRLANRVLPYSLISIYVWRTYLVFTIALAIFGGGLSLKWLLAVETIGFAVAVILRVAQEMGGQSIARQETEDRQTLAWRKFATLQAGEAADAMLAAFPGDAEVRKAAEALRDGFRYAASSTPDTAPLETKLDDTVAAISKAVADSQRDEVLQLCATAAADLKQRHRLSLMR